MTFVAVPPSGECPRRKKNPVNLSKLILLFDNLKTKFIHASNALTGYSLFREACMEITEKFKLLNRLGFHLRAIAKFASVCSRFKCNVVVKNHHHQVDGKSPIGLLTLAATSGMELTVTFAGEDAWVARDAVHSLFLNKFGEKD
jgi:phosphocarrier protein HPr